MLDKKNLSKIEQEAQEFFKKMTFEVEVEVSPEKDGTVPIDIKTDEPQILIGEGGQTLGDIQHLLKIILKRKLKEEIFFIDLDISDYKKKKNEYLKELAKTSADEVSLTKTEKILQPMTAYERRIIHMALAERTDVTAESIGEEPDRRIAIKPFLS
jgi:spoIIIJ-associated protein